jgi:hypothetical protein
MDLPGRACPGSWTLVAQTPDGDITGTLEVSQTGDTHRGWLTYEGVNQSIPIETINVDGREVSFSFTSPDGYVTVTMTRNRNEMSGTALVDGANAVSVTMERSNPEGE